MKWPWRRRKPSPFAGTPWPDSGEGPDIIEPLNEGYLMTAPLRDLARHISRTVVFVDGPKRGGWVATIGPPKKEEVEMLISEAEGFAVYGADGHYRRTRAVTDEDREQWRRNVEYVNEWQVKRKSAAEAQT